MTHGTIKNNETGQELTGEYTEESSAYFNFKIDGTTMDNGFKGADWTFTAEKPPLPTARGTILAGGPGWNPYVLTEKGWAELSSYGEGRVTQVPDDSVRYFVDGHGFKPVFNGRGA